MLPFFYLSWAILPLKRQVSEGQRNALDAKGVLYLSLKWADLLDRVIRFLFSLSAVPNTLLAFLLPF